MLIPRHSAPGFVRQGSTFVPLPRCHAPDSSRAAACAPLEEPAGIQLPRHWQVLLYSEQLSHAQRRQGLPTARRHLRRSSNKLWNAVQAAAGVPTLTWVCLHCHHLCWSRVNIKGAHASRALCDLSGGMRQHATGKFASRTLQADVLQARSSWACPATGAHSDVELDELVADCRRREHPQVGEEQCDVLQAGWTRRHPE